ncbi:ATP synthase I chain [mine drainage metagenome]|uniref:ATP synthase I chain n=1 Tax=mine drainage metagenome TaxID=410659 RepID=A0A1J5REZ0_9ZZZZ
MDESEKRGIFLTATMQVVVSIAGAGISFVVIAPHFGVSVLWGGMAAMVNLAFLAWRMIFGDRPTYNAGQHLRSMYRSSLERFFIVTSLLAIGMLRLKLAAAGVILGFLVGQLLLAIVPIMREIKVK